MAKYIKKINEQMSAPAPSREKERTITPARPTTQPGTTPRRPSPIRRTRPSVDPKPKATAEEVYDRFINELRAANGKIEFDIEMLKSKYGVSESEIVKGFAQFIYEASLEDNEGLPQGYKSDVEGRARRDMDITLRELGMKIPQFMNTVQTVQMLQRGKEQQLEELAETAIRELYGSILDGVKLDIKFPTNRQEIPDEMEDAENEPPRNQDMERLQDPEIIREIQKRKLSNAITQGEAKNTKLILNMPVIKDGIIEIMGEQDGKRFVGLLNEITRIASFFDWNIPMQVQKEMWKNPSGFSGSVSVDWEQPESEEEQEDIQRYAEDILADIESGEDILNTDAEELFDDMQPTIKARGIDFAMLIHEAVKGIYELIAAAGIPEDEEVAKTVIMNTDTLADEIEDLRYGPYIAADLRDFINEFNESSRIENLREHFFGKLMAMPAADFLNLIRNILMKSSSAKTQAQDIINEISQELSNFDMEQEFGSDNGYEEDELEDFNLPSTSDESDEIEGEYEDTLSQSEIQALIDNALDNADYAEVERLAKFLKESIQIIESFNNIKSYKHFRQINESMKNAKDYYLKKVKDEFLEKKREVLSDLEQDDPDQAEELGNPNELSPDDIAQLLEEPDFKFISDLVTGKLQNSPASGIDAVNYAMPFVKFKFDQGASNETLENLYIAITDQSNKGLIKELPLKSIESYAKIPMKDGEMPGFEKLGNDLDNLIRQKEGMWIVKNLHTSAGTRDHMGNIIPGKTPVNQKELYNNAPQELKDKLISVASQYKREGFEIGAYTGKHGKIAKFRSLEAIIESMENKINGAGGDMEENIKLHQDEFPGTSVIWEGADKFLVVYRSSWTLGKFCGFTEWCIRPGNGPYRVGGMSGQFHSYASSGAVQYAMWDYSKDRTDPMRLVGFTIDINGRIKQAADIPNNYQRIPNVIGGVEKTFSNVLDYFEVPAESKQYILDSFKGESDLMKEVGPIYKQLEEGSGIREKDFFDILEKSRQSSIQQMYGTGTGAGVISGLAAEVISSHLADNPDSEKTKNLRSSLWDKIMENGLKSPEFINLFRTIFSGTEYMTEENINRIINVNNDYKQKTQMQLNKATSNNGAVRREFENAIEAHNKKELAKNINYVPKTLDYFINSARKTIESIDVINNTYLRDLKQSIMNR